MQADQGGVSSTRRLRCLHFGGTGQGPDAGLTSARVGRPEPGSGQRGAGLAAPDRGVEGSARTEAGKPRPVRVVCIRGGLAGLWCGRHSVIPLSAGVASMRRRDRTHALGGTPHAPRSTESVHEAMDTRHRGPPQALGPYSADEKVSTDPLGPRFTVSYVVTAVRGPLHARYS